jgi:Zn-dependent membrane protease YugP
MNMFGYGYGLGLFYDPTYILVVIGIVITLLASSRVKSTYAKYARVRSMSGMTGAEAARRILNSAGIYDVSVERIAGNLTDHYDPRSKVLRLSDSVYGSASVAAIGVAAHECGHAIQDQKSYAPLRIRAALVPVANFGSMLAWPIIVIGFIIGAVETLVPFGIILFSAVVLFQLVTLPVEFNASGRAVAILENTGILGSEEIRDTKKVLSAAALTYVASAAAAILQLLRLVILFGGRDRD